MTDIQKFFFFAFSWCEWTFTCFLQAATKLWQGNVFTPVCHSVHMGVSVPACTTGHMTRGLCAGGVSVQGGLYLVGVPVQEGGLCPGRVSVREAPHTVMSGWYASYLNAFLFFHFISS